MIVTLSSTGLAEFKDRECLGHRKQGTAQPARGDWEQRDDADGVGEQHQGGLRAGSGGAPGGQRAADAEQGERGQAADGGVGVEPGVPLDAVRIGHLDGDLYDPCCAWVRHRQIASDGAIVVRPDRFIAWRCPAGSGEPEAALAAALSQILARAIGTSAASAA
jgi:hypothetical protein